MKLSLFAVLSAACIVLAGCSSQLSRSEALERISTPTAIMIVNTGKLSHACIDDGTGPEYRFLVANGFATIHQLDRGSRLVELTDEGKKLVVESHDPDKCGSTMVDLRLADSSAVRVSGIRQDEQTAEVEYTWEWNLSKLGEALKKDGIAKARLSRLQELELQAQIAVANPMSGAGFTSVPINDFDLQYPSSSMSFKKYDDGWR